MKRISGIDKARGLAILLMILDHILENSHIANPVRLTVTRFSMPLFFIVSGFLARRLSRRTYLIGIVGFALPTFIPWIDRPNVLFWYAIGAVILYAARKWHFVPLVAALGLAILANNWSGNGSRISYNPYALFGLMALGAMLKAESFTIFDRLPSLIERIGKRPLTWYLGHLVILQMIYYHSLG